MIRIKDKFKDSPKLNEILTKYLKDYTRYLVKNLSHPEDFLGNYWIEKQNEYVLLKRFKKVSSLFKMLFWGGFCYEKCHSHNQKSFVFGVNQILALINNKYNSHYNNEYDNNRFFVSTYSNDFEGIWSELILLDYLNELGYDISPYDDQSDYEKKTPDFHIVGRNVDIEVKCFTDLKYYDRVISRSASFKPTTTELRNVLRKVRRSTLKNSFGRTLIIIIDISLYYELISKVIGSIILSSNQLDNEFRKHMRGVEGNSDSISPIYFQMRATSTRLLSSLYLVG